MMARYTIQVRSIVEDVTPDFVGGYSARLKTAAPLIFDFDFPIWDEEHRQELEVKILRHYFNKEIGLETVSLWQFYLETKLNEIMPYYNRLYETVDKQYNWLWDTDNTEDFDGAGTTHNTMDFGGNKDTTVNFDTVRDSTENIKDTLDSDTSKTGTSKETLDSDTSKSGTEKDIYDRDDKTISDKTTNDTTDTTSNTTYTTNNSITDKTTESRNEHEDTNVNGTVGDVGKDTYTGNSTETKHLGETNAIVRTDYPQAIIGEEDYASTGETNEHEADSTTTLQSTSTTDKTNTQTTDMNTTRDLDAGKTEDYTRHQANDEDTNVTGKTTLAGKQNQTDTYTQDSTNNKTWSETGTTDNTVDKTWNETGTQDDTRNTDKTGNITGNDKTVGNERTTNNQVDDGTSTQKHKRLRQGASGSRSLTSMLMEYRNSIINIDMMIVSELRELFMTIY